MNGRTKKISRITRLMEQQKEAMEMKVIQTRHRLEAEERHLTNLKNDLLKTLDNFEKKVQEGDRVSLQDVVFLFGLHNFLSSGIEKKQKEVSLIEKELEVLKQFLLEAYQKKEIFGIFRNKMIQQEMRETAMIEQKALDFLNLKIGTAQ
jgi:flagellar biosynthesis chaperone FliJ